MEEEMFNSMVSNADDDVNHVIIDQEVSDSSSRSYISHNNNNNIICKRPRSTSSSSTSSHSSLTKFKGIVLQANGHWGAQIYANHQRVWLGTFKSDKDAAMAYDSAAIRLRSGDSADRNFPWTNVTVVHEPNFQSHYSTEAILNMIRDGSYLFKFADFVSRNIIQRAEEKELSLNHLERVINGNQLGFYCKLLFQKELTPSDVGKLNRLVIPKKYAIKYFPHIPAGKNIVGGKVDEVNLVFYDKKLMRSWKFRYCYWNSSQSFVFTRGWNRFVKEKQLKANDIVAFYVCEGQEMVINDGKAFCNIIDIDHTGKNSSNNIDVMVESLNRNTQLQTELCLGFPQDFSCGVVKEEREDFEDLGLSPNDQKKGLRLFGVQIS